MIRHSMHPSPMLAIAAGWAVALAGPAGPAFAQGRKPPPAPVENNGDPEPDLDAWRRAYDDRGEPAILVVTGWGSGDLFVRGLTGQLDQPDRDGIATQLQSAFEQIINDPAADVELIDSGAARFAARRLAARLAGMDEREALTVVASELDAQLVVVIRLLDYDAGGNAPGRVVVEVISPASGRSLFTIPFEWKLGSAPGDLKRYARVIAARFIADYAARAQTAERFTVRIVGIDPGAAAQRDIVRAFEELPGVRDVRARASGLDRDPLTGEEAAVATYTIRGAGDFVEMQGALAEALADAGVDAEVIDAAGTGITLRVYGQNEPRLRGEPMEQCARRLLLRTPEGEAERDAAREAYQNAGAPSIAVIVNRRLSTAERDRWGDLPGVAGDNVVVIGPVGGRPGARPQSASELRELDQLESQTDMIEAEVQRLLGPRLMDLRLRDTSVARAAIGASLDRDRLAVGQDELIGILKRDAIADIAILGAGRVVGSGAERRYEYTFRAVDLRDSALLATSTVTGGTAEREPNEWVAERLARRAVGELVCELTQAWRSGRSAPPPPSPTTPPTPPAPPAPPTDGR